MKKLLTLVAFVCFGFLRAAAQEAYAVYKDGTLTFYYDTSKSSRSGNVYELIKGGLPGWYRDVVDGSIDATRVIFHSSFAMARPTTTRLWFVKQQNLQQIDGIQYLNTSNVKDMERMFDRCMRLTSLDLRGFDTSNVTSMEGMFSRCASLTSLDLSGFDTGNVTNMSNMFSECMSLTSLDLSGFDTSNVTDMSNMFRYCSQLSELDLSSFDTSNVTEMRGMFQYCSSLTTIYVGSSWSKKAVEYSTGMFYGCHSLVGGQGTRYSPAAIEASYARIDGGSSAPGYLTAKKYDLHVGGTQVTVANAGDVLGNGKVVYDDAANTLTLTDANIRVTGENVFGIYSSLKESLTVVLKGKNTISSEEWTGIFTTSGITLSGSGQLALNGRTGISVGGAGSVTTVAVTDGADVTITATGSGISGSTNREKTAYYTTLSVDGGDTRLAITAPNGAAYRLKTLSLGPGLSIVKPSGGRFIERLHAICASAREAATEVLIASAGNPYDLNGDGAVNVGDVTVLVSAVLSGKASATYDLNGDSSVNVGDVTVLVGAILAQ